MEQINMIFQRWCDLLCTFIDTLAHLYRPCSLNSELIVILRIVTYKTVNSYNILFVARFRPLEYHYCLFLLIFHTFLCFSKYIQLFNVILYRFL